LISPTGFSHGGGDRSSQQAGKSGLSQYLQPMFSFPLWARPFYDLLTTRTSINYFLEQSFMGAVPKDLIDYAYVTAHQPGAEHAPLYFISGKLFTPNIKRNVYEQLKVPTLVLYDRDSFTSFERLPDLLAENQSWQAVRLVPTLGMPHFERTEDTVEVLDRFWE
jgi:pimeloyl-ACP methyl ester carboxylesterase